ncbi:MAG: hypothetical protein Q8O01_06165, partial [Candidatus Omnitrophota bacterium]|nr:hypothetical protein [Candidatus Omnitrophota bacterium]
RALARRSNLFKSEIASGFALAMTIREFESQNTFFVEIQASIWTCMIVTMHFPDDKTVKFSHFLTKYYIVKRVLDSLLKTYFTEQYCISDAYASSFRCPLARFSSTRP